MSQEEKGVARCQDRQRKDKSDLELTEEDGGQ